MPILPAVTAAVKFLAANPALVASAAGGVTSLIAVVQKLRAAPETPEKQRAALDQLLVDLRAEAEAVKATPLPRRRTP